MKIALCIPCLGSPKLGFAISLAALAAHTARANITVDGAATRPELRFFTATTSRLSYNRNWLFAQAVDWGAHYLLWMDADHTFPPDALLRLMLRAQAVVGVNYPRRSDRIEPSATKRNAAGELEGVKTTAEIASAAPLEPVEAIGLGFCLLNMGAVLPALQAASPGSIMPLFRSDTGPDADVGEDAYFCGKLRDAGVAIHVDHALSLEAGHIAETVLTFPR